MPFDSKHSFGKIFKILPAKDIKSINIKWITDVSKVINYKKTCRYLGHVIGHEGPNSLLSVLIKQGLALNLTAGGSPRLHEAFDQFAVQIGLTEKGELEYERVIETVYKFINQIREEGPKEYVYDEMK